MGEKPVVSMKVASADATPMRARRRGELPDDSSARHEELLRNEANGEKNQ